MAIGLAKVVYNQPATFEFTAENFQKAEKIIAKYPAGRQQSAVMPLLTLAQQQHDGWLPKAAMDYIASILGMPPMKVYEVATFYTMYNLQPVGTYHLQVCTTTPCWLRGSDEIMHACEAKLGIHAGETTADGKFTLSEVECLGACVNAPMMELTTTTHDGFYEDLTAFAVHDIIDKLAKGEVPEFGSFGGRNTSEPVTGALTLTKGKKQKPKMKARITSIDDTGEPSVGAAELTRKQAHPDNTIEGRQPYLKQEGDKRREAEEAEGDE
jgi:NADH-quinone oxidoreductase E subunit